MEKASVKHEFGKTEYYYNIPERVLLIGNLALQAHIDAGGHPMDCPALGELLIDRDLELRNPTHNPYAFSSWQRNDYQNYGRWLTQVVEPYDREVDMYVLKNSQRLGIGPGMSVGSGRIYGNLQEFFEDIGRSRKARGRFADWDHEQWIAWVAEVTEDSGGEFSEKALENRQKLISNDEPTKKIIKGHWGSIRNLKLVAGLTPYNLRVSPRDCLEAGAQFLLEYGRLPKRDDFVSSDILPSSHPIYKHFGSLGKYREVLTYYTGDEAYRQRNLPPGFLESVEKLEQRLANPPTPREMLRELAESGWSNGASPRFLEADEAEG